MEIFLAIHKLPSMDLTVTAEVVTTDSGETILLGPVELKVDLPIEMGCFLVDSSYADDIKSSEDDISIAKCAISCREKGRRKV